MSEKEEKELRIILEEFRKEVMTTLKGDHGLNPGLVPLVMQHADYIETHEEDIKELKLLLKKEEKGGFWGLIERYDKMIKVGFYIYILLMSFFMLLKPDTSQAVRSISEVKKIIQP